MSGVGTSYKITRPLSSLPPTKPLVISITGALELNVAQKNRALIVDMVIKNRDVASANVTLNDQPAFPLDSGDTLSEDNVAIHYIAISGITQGVLLAHTLDIALLLQYGALEIA